MSHWLFVVKDENYVKQGLSNYRVFRKRMEQCYFGLKKPHAALQPGDSVLFYVGLDGKPPSNIPPSEDPQVIFAGTAVLDSSCVERIREEREQYGNLGSTESEYRVLLRGVTVWPSPKDVREMINELDFFRRKMNWQSHLQGEVHQISEKDFLTAFDWVSRKPNVGSGYLPTSPVGSSQSLISVSQAATYLGVSTRTIYGWVKSGSLAAFTTPGGGLLRFRKDDLDKCLVRIGNQKEMALSGMDDPVLAGLWGNEVDAAYDRL